MVDTVWIDTWYLALYDGVVDRSSLRILGTLLPWLLVQTEAHAVLSHLCYNVGHMGNATSLLVVILIVATRAVALTRVRPREAVRPSLGWS